MSKVAGRPFCVYTNTLFLQAILRMSHVKQALLILREHLGSPPDFSGVHVAPVFRVMFSRSSCVLFFFFLLAIVLSVLIRFTASDYLFGILWSLYCLSFYDLRLLITPLVSCGHCIASPTIYGF